MLAIGNVKLDICLKLDINPQGQGWQEKRQVINMTKASADLRTPNPVSVLGKAKKQSDHSYCGFPKRVRKLLIRGSYRSRR